MDFPSVEACVRTDSVRVNIHMKSACLGSEKSFSEKDFVKLKEEADCLYTDGIEQIEKNSELEEEILRLRSQQKVSQELETQLNILNDRNNELEEKCEGYEVQLEKLKLERDILDHGLSSLSGLSSLESRVRTAGVNVGEFDLDGCDNVSNLLIENDKLSDKMNKALMLAAIWQKRCLSTEKTNAKLQNRLRILEKNVTVNQQETASRFLRQKSIYRQCKNCHLNIKSADMDSSLCQYHCRRPLIFHEWQRLFQLEGMSPSDAKKRFWSCCNKMARSTPEGCRVGHHVFENLEKT